MLIDESFSFISGLVNFSGVISEEETFFVGTAFFSSFLSEINKCYQNVITTISSITSK